MRRDMYNIDLEIPNSGIFIKGLDNEKLTISLDLIKFMEVNRSKIVFSGNKLDIGKLTKPLNPYIIYNILEENNKNNFNGVKIIDKIEDNNNIVYHFNFGLILNTFIGKSKPPRWINQNTSDNLKELNEIKAFIAPCFFSYEIIGDVTSIPPSELEDLKNDYGYEGKDYKSIFKNEVYINFSCYERMYFSNCEFKSKVSLHIIDNDNTVSFLNGIDFSNCIFEDEINFKRFISGTSLPENKYYNNEQDTLFKNCIFKKRVDFHNSNFFNSIYFNNSHFKDYVDFHECEFKKTACFYGVRFDKTPNFSQAIFKENLNVVNTNLNFTFGNLQERIKQEYKDFNETREKKSLDKFANDFRDSFRNFKSTLIKDNNLLDASNFHKYELYCKELELKFKKLKIFSREWIEKWQLFFYRKLCDHHTDLLLNLRWLVVVVGFVVSVLFVLRYGDGNLLQFFNKDNDLLKILKDMLNIKALNDSNVTYLILLYSFIGLFFVRTFFIFYYLVIFILMLAISPYNLFSVVNFVVKGKLNSFLENTIMVAYALIMILVLFSLQKTARKNSIVPS